jgi:hypothetical protein
MATDPTWLVAYVAEHNRRATFEGLIADLEQICVRDLPPPGVTAIPDSLAWYAQELLAAIAVVRHWLVQGDASVAAREAVVVGMLAATAAARHYWPEVQRWTANVEALTAKSRTAAQVRRENAARNAENLRVDVDDMRRKRPELSANSIAHALLPDHGRGSGNKKKDLAALAKRITRLARRTSLEP